MSKITRHILLVDDEVEFCGAISRLLGAAGYEVTIACTPSEGLNLARTGHYDIVLLDQRFPDGSGLELCRRIREFDTLTPIHFYTAVGRDVDRRLACAAGAQGYLSKQGDLVELVEALQRSWRRAGKRARPSPRLVRAPGPVRV